MAELKLRELGKSQIMTLLVLLLLPFTLSMEQEKSHLELPPGMYKASNLVAPRISSPTQSVFTPGQRVEAVWSSSDPRWEPAVILDPAMSEKGNYRIMFDVLKSEKRVNRKRPENVRPMDRTSEDIGSLVQERSRRNDETLARFLDGTSCTKSCDCQSDNEIEWESIKTQRARYSSIKPEAALFPDAANSWYCDGEECKSTTKGNFAPYSNVKKYGDGSGFLLCEACLTGTEISQQTASQSIKDWALRNQSSVDKIRKTKRKMCKILSPHLKLDYPEAEYKEFGSTRYGIDTMTSDLDLMIQLTKNDDNVDREQQQETLAHVASRLKQSNFRITDITRARVPIIRIESFILDGWHLSCDIKVSSGKAQSQKDELVCQLLKSKPQTKRLATFVKEWAKVRGISGGFKQGLLPSFGYVLMTIQYMQQQRNTHKSLDDLFIGFLDYYLSFDWKHQAVSVARGRPIPKNHTEAGKCQNRAGHQQKTAMVVEDPIDRSDNIGRSVSDSSNMVILTKFQSDRERLGSERSEIVQRILHSNPQYLDRKTQEVMETQYPRIYSMSMTL